MRSRPLRSSFAGLLLLAAGSSEAGTLTSASWVQTISPVSWLAPIQITRTTSQLGAVGTSTATSIHVQLSFPALATSFLAPTNGGGSVHVSLTQGGAQAITATPNMGGGSPSIGGVVRVETAAGLEPLLSEPLHHGAPGRITLNRASLQFAVADFYGWNPDAVTVTNLSGTTRTTFMTTGSFDLTLAGGGIVTLVAPARVFVIGEPVSIDPARLYSLTTLTLHFVPEPSAFALLGLAVAALSRFAAPRRRGASGPPAARPAAPPPR